MDATATVKLDPDAVSPAADSDNEDVYEDIGELRLPKESIDAHLLRVPDLLYAAWDDVGDDEEVELGVLRHYTNTDKWHLQLNSTAKVNEKAPKEYSLTMTEPKAANTFIFSEKNLPKYKEKRKADTEADHQHRAGGKRQKRFQQRFMRRISKDTALAGAIKSEFLCITDDTEEYRKLMKARIEQEKSNQPRVRVLAMDELGSFVKKQKDESAQFESGMQPGVNKKAAEKKKTQANKATRMSQSDLMDILFTHFRDYRYWTMKALKQRVNQPEIFIRETLGIIAELIKSGPASNSYKLKPEYEEREVDMAMIKGETVPEDEAGPEGETTADDDDDGEDDDDEEMEDVA